MSGNGGHDAIGEAWGVVRASPPEFFYETFTDAVHHLLQLADARMNGLLPSQITHEAQQFLFEFVSHPDLLKARQFLAGEETKWQEARRAAYAGNGQAKAGEAKVGGAAKPEEAKAQGSTKPDPETLDTIFAEELEQHPLVPVEWILQDFVLARAITGVFGDGGVGKDLLLFQLVIAMACELPFFGQEVRHGRALYFVVEDDIAELRRRQHAITEHFGIRCADFPGRLKIVPLVGKDTVWAAFNSRAGVVKTTPLFDKVRKMIGDFQPALIIAPNRVNIFGVSQNDDAQARQCMQILASLVEDFETGVIMPAHPSVTGMATGSGTSGTVQWSNGCRLRTYLRRIIDPETKRDFDPYVRQWEGMKANWSPTGKILELRWSRGLFVSDTGVEINLGKADANEAAEAEFLRMLDIAAREGVNVSVAPRAPNNAPRVFAEHSACKLAGRQAKRDLKAAMERLLAKRVIVSADYGPRSHLRSRIVRKAEVPAEEGG